MNKSVAAGLVVGVAVALIGVALYRVVVADDVDCKKHKNHCIRVSVDADTKEVHVDVPKLRKKGKKHVIWWYLDNDKDINQKYIFSDTSIAFTTAGGQAEFAGNCSRMLDDVFMCKDDNGLPGTGEDAKDGYKYTVTVSGSPTATQEDPFIYND